jgi:hypothetical protein
VNKTTCDWCKRTTETTGAILGGKYGQACRECRNKYSRQANGQSAQWYRDRDREDNAKDMLQPFINGKPNTEFIRAYPEQAKDMYNEKELKEYS